MLRRKLGILMVAIVIALAGAQEAAQTFNDLKSSVNDWTRAGLWNGLIVYAQPATESRPAVSDAMPNNSAPVETVSTSCQKEATRNGGNATAASLAKKNSHAAPGASDADAPVIEVMDEANDEVAEAARPEFETKPQEGNILNANFAPTMRVAPRLPSPRAFEEVAKNAPVILKFAREAGVSGDVFMSEQDAARLVTDAAQLAGEQARFDGLRRKAQGATDKLNHRIEVRLVRRAERPDRMRVASPKAERREVGWSEMSSTPPAPPFAPLNAPAIDSRGGHVDVSPNGAKRVCSFDCDATATAEQ